MALARRVAAAALAAALSRGGGGAAGQIISGLYVCTPGEAAACDTEFTACSTFFGSFLPAQGAGPVCTYCWQSLYVCYRDCGAFGPDFGAKCVAACGATSTACAPPEYAGPKASGAGGGAAPGAAAAAAAGAAAAAAAWAAARGALT